MRRTGRYWVFNIVCAILPVLSTAYIAAWTEGTSTWGQYLGIVPCGFGVSGVITTTLGTYSPSCVRLFRCAGD